MTEPIDLGRLEALCNAATPGPWEHIPYGGQNQNGDYSGGYVLDAHGESILDDVYDPDGAFIAGTGPDVVKELVKQLREARAGLNRVLAHADRMKADFPWQAARIREAVTGDE